MTPHRGALAGINVLDFTWAGAGPYATKFLADFGARVIKVESKKHPDIGRMTPPFAHNVRHPDGGALFIHTNTSKLSITLNLQHPKGVEIAKKIAGIADIVVENFTPGVMSRLKLTYDESGKSNPTSSWPAQAYMARPAPRPLSAASATRAALFQAIIC